MQTIQTTRFGEIAIKEEDHMIYFDDGIIGFGPLKKYVLIESPSIPLILWLQSVDAPEIAFPVIEPWFFKRDYKAAMTDADRHSLKYAEGDILKVLCIMTIPADMTKMTVNMKAPVVVDLQKATGTQIILQDKLLEVRTPAHESFSRAMSSLSVNQSVADFDQDESESWTPVEVRRRDESPSLDR